MAEATLKAKLTGDSAEFQRSMREAIASSQEFGREVASSVKEAFVQVAALTIGVEGMREAIDRAFEGVKGVFELSKDLERLHDRTGLSTKDLVMLRTEFKLSGLEADQVGMTINRMQRSIENAADKGGAAAEVYNRLGINLRALQTLNPAAQFELIREKIAGIEDPARRAQAAMAIFGRTGGEMLALFGNAGVMREASSALGGQADILARNAKVFQEISSDMEAAGIKIQGFFVGMAEPIGQVILPVLNKLDSLDLTKWGSRIGTSMADGVRVLYNGLEQGKLGEFIGDSIEYGAATGGNYLVATVQTAFNSIEPIMKGIFANNNFGEGFAEVLTGAAGQFGAALMEAFKLPLLTFQYSMLTGANYLDKAGATLAHAMATAERLGAMHWKDQAEKDAAKGMTASNSVAIRRYYEVRKETDAIDARADKVGADPISYDDYVKAHQKDYFLGTNGVDIGAKARDISEDGVSKLKNAFSTVASNLKSSVTLAVADVFGAGDAGKRLGNDVTTLNKPLPGQGTPNAPDAPYQNNGGDDDNNDDDSDKISRTLRGLGRSSAFGRSAMGGIHKEDDGSWRYYAGLGNEAVGFGDGGAASRAGRMVDNSNGSSMDDMFKQALNYLRDIDGQLKAVAAPA